MKKIIFNWYNINDDFKDLSYNKSFEMKLFIKNMKTVTVVIITGAEMEHI